MEELLVNVIVATAFLFLIRWCTVNFRSKPEDETSCGSCPSCETNRQPNLPANSASSSVK